MKKSLVLLPIIAIVACSSNPTPKKEKVISLYNESSRLYIETIKDEESILLKTYRHKNYGDVPYVLINEFCEVFEKDEIGEKKKHNIKNGKFIVYNADKKAFIFDAKKDIVTTSKKVNEFFNKNRPINNGIPLDFYRRKDYINFCTGSSKTKYLKDGTQRVYNCKKYNFDLVYENRQYYAPFTLLSYLFYGYLNTTFIYNGKNFFDCDGLTGAYPATTYCYSSNGNFLLDRSGGKLGSVLYKNVTPKLENEVYRFENIVESSGQLNVFSLLSDGKGSYKSYDRDGREIDDGAFIKVDYTVNSNKTELLMDYYSVIEPEDTEPISEIKTLRINLDETYFGKKTRSQEVADFTYQELRFAFYELYGNTKNDAVKDFDNFIKDQEYKDDLLSLDASVYDDAMSQLLLRGVDDAHTTIQYPSIFDKPTLANTNYYSGKYEGERRGYITNTLLSNQTNRENAGLSEGLDITNRTAFITFDKFEFTLSIKGFNEYKGTNPNDYADNPMELMASSFNKIKENEIDNVVIDLTCNGGGLVTCMSYLLAYFTKDPAIVGHLKLNDAIIDFHYLADLDQDGVYASDTDSFEGKYNFYILTSSASFSCANHLPTLCRNLNCAKIIGEKTAGGSCIISYIGNSSGYIYHSSSEWTSLLLENGQYVTNDNGVEPDIAIDASHFYDHEYIDQLLSNL